MADPITLKSDEFVHGHIDGFTDDSDPPQPATVDSVEWTIADPNVATLNVTNGGMDVDVLAVDMAQDDPAKNTVLTMHVTENGQADAIVLNFDVNVSSLASPLATRANVSFGPAQKKTP